MDDSTPAMTAERLAGKVGRRLRRLGALVASHGGIDDALALQDVAERIDSLDSDVDRLRAALARVEALHTSDHDDGYCMTCNDEIMPCPTLRAIEGQNDD